MDHASKIRRRWERQLVTRDEVFRVLADARLELCKDWAAHEEAALLTLAKILTRAIRRQRKPRLSTMTRRKYEDVAKRSREFQQILMAFQGHDDPPPLLPVDGFGRTEWDVWAVNYGLDPETRGPKPRTDPDALLDLVAFRQLASGQDKPGFTKGDDAPLAKFLRAAFGLAHRSYLAQINEPGDRQANTLMVPNEGALMKHQGKKADLKIHRSLVLSLFLNLQQKIEN